MTADQLLDAYPDAREAVAWVELMICVPPEGEADESAWDLMMEAGFQPEEVLEALKKTIREEVDEYDGDEPLYLEKLKLAVAQTALPSFRNFVLGKMGAM